METTPEPPAPRETRPARRTYSDGSRGKSNSTCGSSFRESHCHQHEIQEMVLHCVLPPGNHWTFKVGPCAKMPPYVIRPCS